MPELPEVETTRRGIEPHIVGHSVVKVTIRQPRLRWPIDPNMPDLITARKLLDVQRRGKYLLLEFESGTTLLHLGMSGSVRIIDSDSSVGKHDHFDIEFSNGKILRYNDPRRFGAFVWAGKEPFEHQLIARLGVEPLSDAFNGKMIYALSRNRKVAIKQFIMNAQMVVGIGNIYANEALFLSGIRPTRAANRISLSRYIRFVTVIKSVLSQAIKQGGTTLKDFNQVDGKPGYFAQQLNVYGEAGKPCPSCGELLREIRQSGRSTVFCKQCQI